MQSFALCAGLIVADFTKAFTLAQIVEVQGAAVLDT